MFVLEVYNTAGALDALRAASKASLDEELKALTEELKKFEEEGCRPSTLTTRLETFEALRDKAHLYNGILRVTNQDLEDAVARMEAKVNQMLTDLEMKKLGI
jgi:benzoyl-CoA reductase/2-hydroxyglutaryl-CoA dehydratase subunit BcrC/BadD/HgdB